MSLIADALIELYPNALWSVTNSAQTYEGLVWDESNEDPIPSEAEVQAKMDEIQAQRDATLYQRLRKAEYDKLNQYELMFDDKINGTTTWQEAINEIKARYPKPSE
jgi:hypothetical protein